MAIVEKYHKIQTIFKRNPETNFKTLLVGQYSRSEFEYLRHNTWVFTEKVDGTNIRVMFKDGRIVFGGKSNSAQIPPSLQESLANMFHPIEGKFHDMFDDDVCLYGEGYGPKIQNGGKYRDSPSFVLFDVRVGDLWLERDNVEDVAHCLDIGTVPIIGEGILLDIVDLVSDGLKSEWGDFTAEGIVARPKVELYGRDGKRVITKIKSKDFHIKEKK